MDDTDTVERVLNVTRAHELPGVVGVITRLDVVGALTARATG